MDIREIQKLTIANAERYSKKHNIDIDLEWLLLKLAEESGEFANALLVYRKKCRQAKIVNDSVAKENLDKELVDIFTTLILLAENLEIDIFETLNKNVLEKGRRYVESES